MILKSLDQSQESKDCYKDVTLGSLVLRPRGHRKTYEDSEEL